jgi:hypothetical protein
MKTSAGLWIDHREAVIVILSAKGQETMRIKSNVERQLRRAGEPTGGPFPAQEVPPDDSREREYQGDLARYYDEVISHLRPADEVLVFGPGEAKVELKKRMGKEKCGSRILTLETGDKMTEPQIAAHVREHFQAPVPRMGAGRQGATILNQG